MHAIHKHTESGYCLIYFICGKMLVLSVLFHEIVLVLEFFKNTVWYNLCAVGLLNFFVNRKKKVVVSPYDRLTKRLQTGPLDALVEGRK